MSDCDKQYIQYYKDNIEKHNCTIKGIKNLINNYNYKIQELHEVDIKTMKKPIKEKDNLNIEKKWNNKVKSISERNKRIRKLNRRINGYYKEIERLKNNIVIFEKRIKEIKCCFNGRN